MSVCHGIPQTDGLVLPVPTTCQRPSICTERYATDLARMTGECPFVFTSYGIPQTDRTVWTPTCQRLPIRTERYACDRLLMSGEPPLLFTCHSSPQTEGIILSAPDTSKHPST